ncbi:MAG TPA: YraN family protein, partial [Phycisphaerae bacterium]|nr:YraN family protein [Phycisphaerae bacterium]
MNLGAAGERAAAKHLRGLGYRIVARNYRCPVGELDLVAVDEDIIVFVEVKTRRSSEAADPEVNVTRTKQRQIIRTARYYLMEKRAQDRPARFDVVAVLMPEKGGASIDHLV